jgi:hypothetical protein
MTPIFRYEHQGQTFDNFWAVKQFEQDYRTFVFFVTDYEKYQHALSNKTIDLDYNYDLDYLRLLRETKSYIRLYYSGGADSHHILTTAINNKIYIDEIIVITRNLYNQTILQPCDKEISELAIPVLDNLTPEQVGKIVFKNYDSEYMRQLYQSPDWMFNVPGGEIGVRIHQFYDFTDQQYDYADCQIVGLEKPSLVYYKNRWFATTIDTQIFNKAIMPNACLFYMMPENIKSYLVKALKFKNEILNSNLLIDQKFHFFPISTHYDFAQQIGKYQGSEFLNKKDHLALTEIIEHNDFDLLAKWNKSLEYLISVFPDMKNDKSYYRVPSGKFLWFIDLESLEIFSQQELIPNGFEL